MVDEQDAVEMIHLVLDHGGQQPVGLQFADLAFAVEKRTRMRAGRITSA